MVTVAMVIAAIVTTPMAAAMEEEEDMAISPSILHLPLLVQREPLLLARLAPLALPVLPTMQLNMPSTMVVLTPMLLTVDTRTIWPITSTINRLLSNSNSNSLKAHHLLLHLMKLLHLLHLQVLVRLLRPLLGEVVITPYVPYSCKK